MNIISKTRTLNLTEAISEHKRNQLLQDIKMNQDIVYCEVIDTCLILKYTLNQTYLKHILIAITPVLEKLDIKLSNSLMDKLKTEFIYFIETNYRNNINHPSGRGLRLQNIYLELSNQNAEDQKMPLKKFIEKS